MYYYYYPNVSLPFISTLSLLFSLPHLISPPLSFSLSFMVLVLTLRVIYASHMLSQKVLSLALFIFETIFY